MKQKRPFALFLIITVKSLRIRQAKNCRCFKLKDLKYKLLLDVDCGGGLFTLTVYPLPAMLEWHPGVCRSCP
jgi:hypothetical protein